MTLTLKGNSNTNMIYQNTANKVELPKKEYWTFLLLLKSPKSKNFQLPDLKIAFFLDPGAESNIINNPTWNEIQTLRLNLLPSKTSSRLATAQGSILTIFWKKSIVLRSHSNNGTNKLLNKPFKQTFHITDIKHNIVEIPFITKFIPTINILNSKIYIKDERTRMKNTFLTFFQRLK